MASSSALDKKRKTAVAASPAPAVPPPHVAEPIPLTRRSPKPRPEYLAFAARLKDAMLAMSCSASDLARQVWGTATDYRGYKVAKNRDRIGHYLAGVSYPEPENLQKIETALGLPPGALALTPSESRGRLHAQRGASGDVSFTILSAHPTAAVIQIRKLVSVETGMRILELISKDKLPDELDPTKAQGTFLIT